jgi:KUP system potassium uptake protein
LGRITIFTGKGSWIKRWQNGLFAFMARNAGVPTAYFGLPPNRVVELGGQVQL